MTMYIEGHAAVWLHTLGFTKPYVWFFLWFWKG